MEREDETLISALTVREESSKLKANQWGPSWPALMTLMLISIFFSLTALMGVSSGSLVPLTTLNTSHGLHS